MNKLRNISGSINTLAVLLILLFQMLSCTKKVVDPNMELCIKLKINDTQGLAYNCGIKRIIPLADNTFWIHYKLKDESKNMQDKIEHYDENFKLLDSVYFYNYVFDKFQVCGNNDIIVSAAFINPQTATMTYQFLQFNNRIQQMAQDTGQALLNPLRPVDNYLSYKSILRKRSDGVCYFAFACGISPQMDSARIIYACYQDPLNSSLPKWVVRKKHYDHTREIYNTVLKDMEVDNQHNMYLLLQAEARSPFGNSFQYVIRKHDLNGQLLWQTPFSNDYSEGGQLMVEGDRIVVSLIEGKIFSFDSKGNILDTKNPILNLKSLTGDSKDGYLAISDTSNTGGHFVKVIALDRNFNLKNFKIYGNQGTQRNMALGKLSNGKFVVAAFVESPNLIDFNLLLFKINENLDLID